MDRWQYACLVLAQLLVLQWLQLELSVGRVLVLAALAASLSADFREYVHVFIKTFPRDMRGMLLLLKVKRGLKRFESQDTSIAKEFKTFVKKHPQKVALICDDKKWTYKQMDDYINRISNVFLAQGMRRGDAAALLLDSGAQYPCVWLGLSQLGVASALINFNLRQLSLVHSIKIANAKALIYGAEFAAAIEEIRSELPSDLKYYELGSPQSAEAVRINAQSLDALLEKASASEPPDQGVRNKDKLCYIYTSGTTGLPKAAPISNLRYYFIAYGAHCALGLQPDDILYDSLPLYHSAGGCLGVGQAIIGGNTVVIRSKFSASKFWDDCIQHKCTVIEYIGEMCRYVLAQPEAAKDRQHRVRLAFGSGLKPQIWREFVTRFNIEKVVEIYGATEGNANIVNIDNTFGAVGFISMIAPWAYPCALIRVDKDTGKPIRDQNGVCVRCKPGEPGEFVGIVNEADPLRKFDGYADKAASDKKLIRDAFSKGDTAFLSGDVLVMDRYGYLNFLDRTGDTFRWKGENVSTAEVEAIVSNILQQKDSVSYGVEIPGTDGKAGMVAILDPEMSVDLALLAKGLTKQLPSYARPIFVRIVDSVSLTGTFKLKKVDLQQEGFDPNKCGKSQLFYWNRTQYSPLDAQIYQDIVQAKIRL